MQNLTFFLDENCRCRPSFRPRRGKCWLKKLTNTKAETNKQTNKQTSKHTNRQDKNIVQFLLRRNCPTAPQNFKMLRPLKDTCVWLDAEKAWRIIWIWHYGRHQWLAQGLSEWLSFLMPCEWIFIWLLIAVPWHPSGGNPRAFSSLLSISIIATLETRRKLDRVNFHKDIWDCDWEQRKTLANSWPARPQCDELAALHADDTT